jgi:hypothetical protein
MIVAVHRPAGADVSPRCPVIGGYPERINERIQSIACSKRPVRREPVGEAGLDIEIVHDVRCRQVSWLRVIPLKDMLLPPRGLPLPSMIVSPNTCPVLNLVLPNSTAALPE